MAVHVDGKSLRIENVVAVARHGEEVVITPQALDRIRACRAMIERKIAARPSRASSPGTGIPAFCIAAAVGMRSPR